MCSCLLGYGNDGCDVAHPLNCFSPSITAKGGQAAWPDAREDL